MMKYIIKNCPAYLKYNKCFHNGHCDNITDCLLKRIVGELRKEACTGIDCNWCMKKCNLEKVTFSKKILELLEIEECENA